jgi:hypothetical protein
VLDEWVGGLKAEAFTQLVPLLRRTFAQFSPPERRQIGQRAKQASSAGADRAASPAAGLDESRARKVLPVVARLLGIDWSEPA